MSDDEDEYGISVSVWHPDVAKVELQLSWAEPQSRDGLLQAAASIAEQATNISMNLAAEAR